MKKNSYTVILLVFFTHFWGYAFVPPVNTQINIQGHETRVPLNGKILHYATLDSNFIPTAESVSRFHPLPDRELRDEGKSGKYYHWIILSFRNNSEKLLEYYITTDNVLVGNIEYYEMANNRLRLLNKTGDELPFNSRPIKCHTFSFPVTLIPKETTSVAFRIYHGGRKLYMPIFLNPKEHAITNQERTTLFNTLVNGFVFFAVVINIALFFFSRDVSFLALALYSCSISLFEIVITGFGFQHFYPSYPQFNNTLAHFSVYFLSFSTFVFIRYYFDRNKNSPWVNHYLLSAIVIIPILTLSIWLDDEHYYSSLLIYKLLQITFISALFIGVALAIKQHKISRFYFLAFLIYAVILVAGDYVFVRQKIEENLLSSPLINGLFSFACFMFTVAKFDRFRILRDEKEAALSESVKHLENLNRYKEEVNQSLNEIVDAKTREIFDKQLEVNKALVKGEEQERQRVSMELHDGLGSLLSVMKLNLSMIADDVQKLSPETLKVYENTLQLLNKSHEELRSISHNLMPPVLERYGLQEAILNLKEEIDSKIINIDFHFVALNERLPIEIEVTIYRIIQELIQNIIRHSGANKATIQLTKEETLFTIIAEDNGKGITQNDSKSGQGLSSMKNRTIMLNGTFTIDRVQQKGTTIIVEIPLQNQKNKV